jgi:hypothetical protein
MELYAKHKLEEKESSLVEIRRQIYQSLENIKHIGEYIVEYRTDIIGDSDSGLGNPKKYGETIVKEINKILTGQWKEIKKDGKPKENGRYLVMCEEGRCTAYYDYLYGWQGDNYAEESSDAPYYEHVTHWTEILEEPK